MDLTHEAATPPGLEVTVRVRLKKVDGRRLESEVEASDGADIIGRGSHRCFVIDRKRFDRSMEGKRRGETKRRAGG